jgi:beta-glucanase (GH16 family)
MAKNFGLHAVRRRFVTVLAGLSLMTGATVTVTVTAAVSGATTSPAPTCGSQTLLKGNGTPWTCTFDDEFNGTSLDAGNWLVQLTANSGYHSGQECFVNTPNNVSVSGGTLNLTVRQEARPFFCQSPVGGYATQYTSGMVSTIGRFAQTYGLFEIRAKLPPVTVRGLQESFWMWPAGPTSFGNVLGTSPEIDIAEFYSKHSQLAIPTLHYNPLMLHGNDTNYDCAISDVSQFHTYALQWTPTMMKFMYDGQTCLTDYRGSPLFNSQSFNQPFFLVLTQALGIGDNVFGPAVTPLPATTQIDWVRAWA